MFFIRKILSLTLLIHFSFLSLTALEPADQDSIHSILQRLTESWNLRAGREFAVNYSEDADFVNIFGMIFSGKKEIEDRHLKILQTLLKDSKLEILDVQLREVQPNLVIALMQWRLDGFRNPGTDINKIGEIRDGVFTHVFIQHDNKWEITSSQNTLRPK